MASSTDLGAAPAPTSARTDGAAARIRVGIIGATGYVGGELVRLLAAHPSVELVGLTGRGRQGDPIGGVHPHLATTDLSLESDLDGTVDAVFLALPHGTAATRAPELLAEGITIIDQGPDFRLADPADYPRWYGFEHPHPELLARSVYGLPELHRAALVEAAAARAAGTPALVGSPGCYPTATVLALAPLARAGLIADVVVDAKSGVSGAGREAKAEMLYAEVNESVKAYGIFNHRHTAEMEQELGLEGLDFLPHLIPMTRGILAAGHVRPTRPISQAELDALYAEAYANEPFVTVVDAPPATGHVLGSNHARVFVRADERTGRILAIGVIDNLVKGAAGQGVQAFNLVFGLPESAGLEALPLAP
ncbi:MAG TPA: N-acetyl-gamma-glutamyl-phosphate reductase [Candidatus Limnocylindrales bacterium]|nr:N-acetyl-gamma-glutamyl-phosphate reductase [Candidatus Limnocylindrales bacterium]